MSVIAGALIGGGLSLSGSIGGALIGSSAQKKSTKRAIEAQERSEAKQIALTAPQREIGNQALALLGGLFGLESPSLLPGGKTAGFDLDNLSAGQADALGKFRRAFGGNDPFSTDFTTVDKAKVSGNKNLRKRVEAFSAEFGFDPLSARPPGSEAATGGPQQGGLLGLINNNPGIQFVEEQGNKALQQKLAATGLSQSGTGLKAGLEFNQGLALTNFQNLVLNPLFQLAGFGPQANQQAGNAVQNTGTNLANLALGQGNNRASAFGTIGNAVSDIGNTIFAASLDRGNRLRGASNDLDALMNNRNLF